MWHTSHGDRTLVGAEADWDDGVRPFDSLAPNQKLALLADVGRALLMPDCPMPELTAVSESAVAALYENVLQQIQIEIDYQRDEESDVSCWRSLVLQAVEQLDGRPDPTVEDVRFEFSPKCVQMEEWEVFVVTLTSFVLWDDDWVMETDFMDLPPAVNRAEKRRLGITDNYFAAIAPDPTESELPRIRESLRRICEE